MFAGDIDDDGDVDLVTMSGQSTGYHLWRNNLNNADWLEVRLVGAKIPTAVGSKIYLYEAGHAGDAASLVGYREVTVGTSHRAPLEQHFGVDATKKYDVRVQFWPGKNVVDIANVSATQRLRISEDGSSQAF